MRLCETVMVTHVRVTEGEGTEESPYRHVEYYYEPEGKLIAKHDCDDPNERKIKELLAKVEQMGDDIVRLTRVKSTEPGRPAFPRQDELVGALARLGGFNEKWSEVLAQGLLAVFVPNQSELTVAQIDAAIVSVVSAEPSGMTHGEYPCRQCGERVKYSVPPGRVLTGIHHNADDGHSFDTSLTPSEKQEPSAP